jgi:voltage-gated potassium channel
VAMRRPWIDLHLAKIPIFRSLAPEQLRLVSALATHVELPAGVVLTTEQGCGFDFILIARGHVELRYGDRVVRTRGPGEHFGEETLFGDGHSAGTVVASSPVTLEVIRRDEFLALLDDFPELGREVRASAPLLSTGRRMD